MRSASATISLFVRLGVTLDPVQSVDGAPRGADRIPVVARPTGPMSRVRPSRLALVAALWLGPACFTEPGIDPPVTDDTGGPSCMQGSAGCECYGNGTCDQGLTCETDLQRCIPENCTPGEDACVCAEGQCDAPSECNSGICESPGADDGVDDGGPGTSGTTTAGDGSSATSVSADDTSTSEPSTTGDPDSTTGPGPEETSDSGGPVCDAAGGECEPCFDCVDAPGSTCEDAHDACLGISGCMTAVSCLTDCGLDGICFDPCCEGLDNTQVAAINALLLCRTDHCTSSCGRFEIPTC